MTLRLPTCAALALSVFLPPATLAAPAAALTGLARIPADTFAEGPPSGAGSGEPISANDRSGPFDGQPVQGFSSVQPGAAPGTFRFLSDNGFGARDNSADYLLRIYDVAPGFDEDDATARVVSHLGLSDPHGHVPFPIVNERTKSRLLTGADFDTESLVVARDGTLWIGDEFGPYILHFGADGRLLAPPVPTPDLDGARLDRSRIVTSPDYPAIAAGDPGISSSHGFEGMAASPDGRWLYAMLEGTVYGDLRGLLRLYRFDADAGRFDRFVGFYELDDAAHAIGDIATVNDRELLVIERDGKQGYEARFKKIFLVDLSRVDGRQAFHKTLLADLLDIHDPADLDDDGQTTFRFPFFTIENLLLLDERTLLVANDNNYPFSKGRGPDIDDTEIIRIELAEPLDYSGASTNEVASE